MHVYDGEKWNHIPIFLHVPILTFGLAELTRHPKDPLRTDGEAYFRAEVSILPKRETSTRHM